MRKFIANTAGIAAAVGVLWEAGTVGRVDSMVFGTAVVVWWAFRKATLIAVGKVADANAKVNSITRNSEAGRPLFTGDPDELLIAHAKRWGAEV